MSQSHWDVRQIPVDRWREGKKMARQIDVHLHVVDLRHKMIVHTTDDDTVDSSRCVSSIQASK